MGFEMDPRELSNDETALLKEVTSWWKANRNWIYRADILRLDSPDPAVIAEQQLAEGGGNFVVFAGKAGTSSQIAPRPLTLTRLTPDEKYRVELINERRVWPWHGMLGIDGSLCRYWMKNLGVLWSCRLCGQTKLINGSPQRGFGTFWRWI